MDDIMPIHWMTICDKFWIISILLLDEWPVVSLGRDKVRNSIKKLKYIFPPPSCRFGYSYVMMFKGKSIVCWFTLFSPKLSQRPVLGLWTTLENKFIQKEGARMVIMGIIVILTKNFLSMAIMLPFQYETMVVHKKISKSRMNKLFPLLIHYYKVNSY